MPGKKTKAPQEIELKFELPADAATALLHHPLLASGTLPARTQRSEHFDTPDFVLFRRGFQLRVRHNGEGYTQTLKQRALSAGLFARDEWEQTINGPRPEAAVLQDTPLGKHPERLGDLQPMVCSTIDRRTWLLERDGSLAEIVLDQGIIETGGRQIAVSELELELKRRSPTILFEIARDLQQLAPLRIGVLSKAERGFALASGELGIVQKAVAPELKRRMPVAAAFTAILLSTLRHYRLNEPLVGGSPEALHQARVAMRRLRAAFSLFGGVLRDGQFDRLRGELRWFTGSLGQARDLDVFAKRHSDQLDAEDRERLQAARRKAYRSVSAAIGSKRLRTLLLDLITWASIGSWREGGKAQASLGRFAQKRLDRLWARVKDGGARLQQLEEEARHRFRIDVKKLRYAIEFLGSLYKRRKVRDFTKLLEEMQERLGSLNDQVVARQLAADLSLDLQPEASEAGQIDQLKQAADAFERLCNIGPFWRAD